MYSHWFLLSRSSRLPRPLGLHFFGRLSIFKENLNPGMWSRSRDSLEIQQRLVSVLDQYVWTWNPLNSYQILRNHLDLSCPLTTPLYLLSSPLHSFTPGLKLSFSANPSHHSLPFLLLDWLHGFPGLLTDTSEHIRFFLSSPPVLHC